MLTPEQKKIVCAVFDKISGLDVVQKDNEDDPDMYFECDIDMLRQHILSGDIELDLN